MFRPSNFDELCRAMQLGAQVEIVIDNEVVVGIIRGLETEDNSGRCWIISLEPKSGLRQRLFFRNR